MEWAPSSALTRKRKVDPWGSPASQPNLICKPQVHVRDCLSNHEVASCSGLLRLSSDLHTLTCANVPSHMNTHTFPRLVGRVLRKLPNGLYNSQIWHAFIPSQGINHSFEPWADTGWILERHFAANSKAARVWSLPVSSVEKQSALQAPSALSFAIHSLT